MNHIVKHTKENESKGKVVELPCPTCFRQTQHVVLQSIDKNGGEYDSPEMRYGVEWFDHFQIVECQGCETTSFRHTHWFSEDDRVYERLYPQRSPNSISAKDLWNVPDTLRRLYRETIDAFNFEASTLCAAGLRAIVEGICAEHGVSKGSIECTARDGSTKSRESRSLEGKISGLAEKHILTKQNAAILHEHRFLGNDAVHELAQPSRSELSLAIQIIEHTLESLYEIPKTAAMLREQREGRRKMAT